MSVEIFTEDKDSLREKPNSHGALYPYFLVPRLSEVPEMVREARDHVCSISTKYFIVEVAHELGF